MTIPVLALDLARNVGWAVDADGPPRTGCYTIRGGANDLGLAGLSFQDWLYRKIDEHKPDVVAFEAPMLGGARRREMDDHGKGIVMNYGTTRLLLGLAFAAETVARSCRVECYEEHVQTVRKYFLGHGRLPNPKERTVARCRELGWTVRNADAADAAALWAYVKSVRDKSFRVESTTPLFRQVSSSTSARNAL